MPTPDTPETTQPDLTIRTVVYGENPHAPAAVNVLLSVKPSVNAPNTRVEILLPDGVMVTSGSSTWNGDLKAGQFIYLNLLLRFKSLAKAEPLWFNAAFSLPDGSEFTRHHPLFARPVADGKIEISTQPFSD